MNRRAEIGRYARTLAEQSHARGTLPQLRRDLEGWAAVLAQTPSLQVALGNPGIPLPERKALLEAVNRQLGAHDVAGRVVGFLLEQNRLASLADVAATLGAESDRLEGRVRVRLRSARPLAPEVERRMIAAFRKRMGRDVVLDKQVDPSLIGGVVAQAGDLSFDGSIRSRLRRLGEHLRQQAMAERHP